MDSFHPISHNSFTFPFEINVSNVYIRCIKWFFEKPKENVQLDIPHLNIYCRIYIYCANVMNWVWDKCVQQRTFPGIHFQILTNNKEQRITK